MHMPHSALSDEELLAYFYNKPDPSDLELEFALRLENRIGDYHNVLEIVHTATDSALGPSGNMLAALTQLHEISAPAEVAIQYVS